jgi:hypothetical protein
LLALPDDENWRVRLGGEKCEIRVGGSIEKCDMECWEGVVDGESRDVGQTEERETRKRASGSIYTFCKLGLCAIYEIIST